jgi:hypothetical protein
MRVLIGCECSGIVRDAFSERGHDAWSCDLKKCERDMQRHLQMDVMSAIEFCGPWDFIGLHPDCAKMAVSGNRWYGRGTPGYDQRQESTAWTVDLWLTAIKEADRVYLENPVSVVFTELKKRGAFVQYVQPWEHGHGETKRTGIALHGLTPLKPTDVVSGRDQRIWKMPPSKTRKADRSRTYPGIASAMASQWGHCPSRPEGQ